MAKSSNLKYSYHSVRYTFSWVNEWHDNFFSLIVTLYEDVWNPLYWRTTLRPGEPVSLAWCLLTISWERFFGQNFKIPNNFNPVVAEVCSSFRIFFDKTDTQRFQPEWQFQTNIGRNAISTNARRKDASEGWVPSIYQNNWIHQIAAISAWRPQILLRIDGDRRWVCLSFKVT